MDLVCKQQKNEDLVDISIFFFDIWFTDRKKVRKNDKVFTFNAVHFPNFEISFKKSVALHSFKI